MQGKIKVLYIDDEINNLHSFRAAFRHDYQVLTSGTTDEAVNQLRSHPDIAVIISDQRMPNKTGVEFFEEIRNDFSLPVRMLITGYTDVEAVIEAINRGQIFRYIKKPWSEMDVKSAIEEGYSYYVTTSLLAEKNKELQKAYNELDKFAYSVTHDLRSPILSVLGAINIAKTTEDPKEVQEMVDLMEKAMHKLDNFIHNIHDYYNLRRGELEIKEINFPDLIDQLKDIFDLSSKTNDITFTIDQDIKGGFRSDETSLLIILNNLLSNAFKYQKKNTEGKFVKLDIAVHDNILTIAVSDNGIGIHENYLQYIFDMFYRATTEEFGSGFGLYNVKDALTKLGGEIDVTSRKDEGTTFKLTIPGK
ncbi:hybrid sensor histidine kinase/response regulator [Chitinophagaceae bacterium MMS25-I14]